MDLVHGWSARCRASTLRKSEHDDQERL